MHLPWHFHGMKWFISASFLWSTPPTHTPTHTPMSLMQPYCPLLHEPPSPQKNPQPYSDDFDSLAYLKLAFATSRCEKRKCFQALPHSFPTITFYPYSVFFPPLRLFFCSLPFCRHKGSSLALLKMTTMSSVSYFHVIYNWNPPLLQKKKKKKVGWGKEGGKTL